MHFKTTNINTAFQTLVAGIHSGEIPTSVMASRYGEVMAIEEPVTVTYQKPLERCLFNQARDVNPFALLYESLWMIAGRNDVAPLTYYTPRFKEFSDNGETLNGAYGYRWRFSDQTADIEGIQGKDTIDPVDQIKVIIDHLRCKPASRRAVLQIWNVEADLLKIDTSRDVCCNLSVLFSVEMGRCPLCNGNYLPPGKHTVFGFEPIVPGLICPGCNGKPHEQPRYLNMTVMNRSNDLVWGMLGANYVTFSVLQEYMAAHLGLEVGVYHQISNNLHVYTNNWQPEKWLADKTPHFYNDADVTDYDWAWGSDFGVHLPLVKDPTQFDKELSLLVEHFNGILKTDSRIDELCEPFLRKVAGPMFRAFQLYKHKELETAIRMCDLIKADDWRMICTNWLKRREAKRAARANQA